MWWYAQGHTILTQALIFHLLSSDVASLFSQNVPSSWGNLFSDVYFLQQDPNNTTLSFLYFTVWMVFLGVQDWSFFPADVTMEIMTQLFSFSFLRQQDMASKSNFYVAFVVMASFW